MKLNELKTMVAKAIELEDMAAKAAEKVAHFDATPATEQAAKAVREIFHFIAETHKADKEAQFVLRTCAEIAIGDRLGAFARAPEEMRLGMEHARLREYVADLDPVNSPEDADRFEAVVLGLARYFGADEVEEILFGGRLEPKAKKPEAKPATIRVEVLADPIDYLYN